MVGREHGYALDALAKILELDAIQFRSLVENPEGPIDTGFVIDVIAALVSEFAIDPEWLLTGTYDASIHRQALVLREDRSPIGQRALRDFVQQRYARIRGQATATLAWPGDGNK